MPVLEEPETYQIGTKSNDGYWWVILAIVTDASGWSVLKTFRGELHY